MFRKITALLGLLAVSVSALAQSAPPQLTFAPGSSWSVADVIVPPKIGTHGWQGVACVSTTVGSLDLGRGFSVTGDVLGGFSLANGAFNAGYGACLQYNGYFNAPSDRINWFAKIGACQLYGPSTKPTVGAELAVGLSIAGR